MKAKWTSEIFSMMEDIQMTSRNVKTPFLVLHGDDDMLVSIEGSVLLHNNSQSTDKTLKVNFNSYRSLARYGKWNFHLQEINQTLNCDRFILLTKYNSKVVGLG